MEEAQWHLFCVPSEARQDESGSQQFPAWRQNRSTRNAAHLGKPQRCLPRAVGAMGGEVELVSVERQRVTVAACLPVCRFFLTLSQNDGEKFRTFCHRGTQEVQISVSLLYLPCPCSQRCPRQRGNRVPVKPRALPVWGSTSVQEVTVEKWIFKPLFELVKITGKLLLP